MSERTPIKMKRLPVMRCVAVVTALALTAAACGSDDDEADVASTPAETSSAAPETAASAPVATEAGPGTSTADSGTVSESESTTAGESGDPLGEPNPATGEELKLMYMWSGVSPAVDNSADLAAMKAMVQYINEYGGGIGTDHRKLVLDDCPTNSDTAVAAACGSTIVDGGYPMVLFNVIGEIEPWATPTLAAGIPIFNFSSSDASILGSPDLVFSMSNPANGIAFFPAALAKDVGAGKTTIDVIDVPAASGPVQALAPMIFEQAGAGEVNTLPISPTAPDHSSDIQAELQSFGPDYVHIIGNPAYCSLSIRALRDADFKGTISGISNCIDAAAKEQLGADLEGVYLSYSAGEDPADPDYAQFLSIIDKYDPSIVPNGTPVGAYVVLESFRRVMEDYSGDYTSADLASHIRNHGPLPHPTTGGTFQCNSQALAILPIACTSAFAYSQLDAEGNPTTFTGASAS